MTDTQSPTPALTACAPTARVPTARVPAARPSPRMPAAVRRRMYACLLAALAFIPTAAADPLGPPPEPVPAPDLPHDEPLPDLPDLPPLPRLPDVDLEEVPDWLRQQVESVRELLDGVWPKGLPPAPDPCVWLRPASNPKMVTGGQDSSTGTWWVFVGTPVPGRPGFYGLEVILHEDCHLPPPDWLVRVVVEDDCVGAGTPAQMFWLCPQPVSPVPLPL